jgi:hypothetical protein
MLRTKKYNIYKHLGLNLLLNFSSNDLSKKDYEYLLNEEYVKNTTITTTKDYNLIKETVLEPYILTLNNILLIHLKDNYIQDFEFLYKNSTTYVFDVYETSYPHLKKKSVIKMYHIFCISKKLSSNTNYISFLKTNDSDIKYTCLAFLYGPCLLVNRRFDITYEYDKYNAQYKYLKTIGQGKIDYSIRTIIKNIINMANQYQNTLPPHYLKIN